MAVPSLALAGLRLPPAPLIKCSFDLRQVCGLSPRALEAHLALYEEHVEAANRLHEQLAEYPSMEELSARERLGRDGLVRRLSFEHNGVLLHEAFFEALGGGRGRPAANGRFSDCVDANFGGFEAWRQDVMELGATRGVGWVIACRSSGENRLINIWVDGHTDGLIPGFDPVAVFDLWEHAWLPDFKPGARQDYLRVLFDNIDWDVVESRCV